MIFNIIVVATAVLFISYGMRRCITLAWKEGAHLTAFCFLIGFALLLRSPGLGDGILERFFASFGVHNVPDVLGHVLSVVAMSILLDYLAGGRERFEIRVICLGQAAIFAGLLLLFWATRGSAQTSAVNMVQLPGMEPYSIVFSLAILLPQIIALAMFLEAARKHQLNPVMIALLIGSLSGTVMALHRLLVVAIPSIADHAYLPIAWAAALTCATGYVGMSSLLMIERKARITR